MKRTLFAALLVLSVGSLATGCRSCQSCHDYGRPVDNCTCQQYGACGNGRAGSVLAGGYATPTEEYVEYEEVEAATE